MPYSLFNFRDFPEVVLLVVEIVLTGGTSPLENMMASEASCLCSLRILELLARAVVLRQKRCHPRNESHFSPA